MKTAFTIANVAKAAKHEANLRGKVSVTFNDPAGKWGRHVRSLKPKVGKDGAVTVRAFNGLWKLEAKALWFALSDGSDRIRSDDGTTYRALIYFEANKHIRWLDEPLTTW